MKQLIATIFSPIAKDYPLFNQDLSTLQNVYDEFATAVFAERGNALSMETFYNSLCYAQVELKSLQKEQTAMREKKLLYKLAG